MKSTESSESEAARERFADVRTHLPFLAKHEGLARALEGVLAYPKLRQAFADSAGEKKPFHGVAQRLGLTFHIADLAEKIPASGPIVVVANHAYGGADALALMASMCDLRADFKVLANQEVTLLASVAERVIPVSLLKTTDIRENTASLRAMLRHVKEGGSLGVFPAGRVAYWQGDRMADPPWNEHVVRLLQRMNATIVPVWFFGSPPPAINALSRLSGFLRTALIPTGLARMSGREVSGRAGEAIASEDFRALGPSAGPFLRRRLESLASCGN